jgi:geranylgeranyl pyrophosphate synthase
LELGHALLMGDYLIAAGLGLGGALGSSTVDILAGAIKSMAEGQAQQLSRRYRADTSDEFYIKTAKNKAGALFAAACQLGAAGSPAQPALRKYGEDFGVAFQIIDDMVDLDFGPAQEPAARLAAQKYSSSAQKRLLRLPDSPLKWGLAELPGLLLEVSLA